MRYAAIEHALPSQIVTNEEVLARIEEQSRAHLSGSDLQTLLMMTKACFSATQTTQRYHRRADEKAYEIALSAGEQALKTSGVDPKDIDLILYVGVGRGMLEPASATIFQDMLGLHNATGFDIVDACASWMRAIELAHAFIERKLYRNVMIMNAECLGRDAHRYEVKSLAEFAYWHPCVTLGEAATATILTETDIDDEFHINFRTWGSQRDLCYVPTPYFDDYFGKQTKDDGDRSRLRLFSHGLKLLSFGAEKVIEQYQSLSEFREFSPDMVFGHNASDGMSESVLRACNIDFDKFEFTHRRFANTISASVPIAMSVALKENKLKFSDNVLILFASAGISTAVAKFKYIN